MRSLARGISSIQLPYKEVPVERPKINGPIGYSLRLINGSARPVTAVSAPAGPPKPRLLDQVREAIRTRHYSYRTEKAYVHWIKRFIFFHNKRHPVAMAEPEIARFLASLASESHVSASTQNQAQTRCCFCTTTCWLKSSATSMVLFGLRDQKGYRLF